MTEYQSAICKRCQHRQKCKDDHIYCDSIVCRQKVCKTMRPFDAIKALGNAMEYQDFTGEDFEINDEEFKSAEPIPRKKRLNLRRD